MIGNLRKAVQTGQAAAPIAAANPAVIDITSYQKEPYAASDSDITFALAPSPRAEWDIAGSAGVGGGYAPVIRMIYNGEKNFGELGPVVKHIIDHERLGQRSWQLYLESETIHTIVKQKGRWTIGTGLQLQCEPQTEVLEAEGIKIDAEKFNDRVEALWKVTAFKTSAMDYARRVPLHKIAKRAQKNASIFGYVLTVLRVNSDNVVTVQLIDGQHVATPMGLSTVSSYDKLVDNFIGLDFVWTNGNRIRRGVEINDAGEPVAYHVRTGIGFTYTRIPARDSQGSLRAFLVVGEEFRLDTLVGVPEITPNMESAKQLDDYTSATVGSAVERQRIAYFIQHEVNAEGIDPRAKNLAKVVGTGGKLDMPVDVNGDQLANNIAVSTNKQTFNMRPGSTIHSPESKQELHYKDFHEVRANAECATVGIPPEVAFQLYGGSYSASRAATNGFQFMLNIDRDDFGDQFYQLIYILQLDVWVLTFKVQAPGYIDALLKKNNLILSAYRFANWVGEPVPQVDELKEVQAKRLLLGTAFDSTPLSTVEKVTRDLGEGNAKANLKQAAQEWKDKSSSGIPEVQKAGKGNPEQESDDTEKPKPKKKQAKKANAA